MKIDDRFFETFHLTPAKEGDRRTPHLPEAIRESGKTDIATIIIRKTQHLAPLDAIDEMLVLTMMRFADELAEASEFAVPETQSVRPQELEMAKSWWRR